MRARRVIIALFSIALSACSSTPTAGPADCRKAFTSSALGKELGSNKLEGTQATYELSVDGNDRDGLMKLVAALQLRGTVEIVRESEAAFVTLTSNSVAATEVGAQSELAEICRLTGDKIRLVSRSERLIKPSLPGPADALPLTAVVD
jgi:hypothetical protein